ncbi:MAG TPA: hypothetical protein VMB72_10255 [Acidimicrobiales bacterium]|nr:hypothetical protein [Acidimicrobiales bacterium]
MTGVGAPHTNGAGRAPVAPVAAPGGPDGGGAPLTTLRGAGVDTDIATVARVVAVVVVLCLLVTAAVLFAAGADKNAQITALRSHGVPVQIKVTRCLGLLGGSGSNAAGYACTGTYKLGGRRYTEAIPSNALHPVGSTVRGVAVRSDPGLLSLPATVASERASWRVFVAPSVLTVVALVLVALVLRRRRPRAAGPRGGAGGPAPARRAPARS